MSKETYEAVQEALKAHMADEYHGAYLIHWVLAAHAVDSADPNASYYAYFNHEGPPHEWMGLVTMLERRALYRQWRDIGGYEENET